MSPSLLLAAVLATASAAEKPQPIVVEPKRVTNVDIGLSGATFDVVLEAERTRGLTVKLRHLDYSIQVGKTVVAEGAKEYDSVRLRKGEPVLITVPVEMSGIQALELAGRIAAGRDLKVKVKGNAGIRVWFFPMTIPFAASN